MIRVVETRLLFVRHGEAVHTVEGIFGGPKGCRGLTQSGREQAAKVAQRLTADLDGAEAVSIYSSTLPRAIETASIISIAVGVIPTQDCGLCTWHIPDWMDGQRKDITQSQSALPGGGIYRPFQAGNETWAEMVVRGSRTIVDIADRHRGTTVIIVGHSETVEISFHALGLLPLHRSFDLRADPASTTEWLTNEDPTDWPPPRWTLVRFNDTSQHEPAPRF